MFIVLNEKLADVNLTMMPPLLEFLSKGSKCTYSSNQGL